MKKASTSQHWSWSLALLVFYIGLGLWGWSAWKEWKSQEAFSIANEASKSHAGNDWVSWKSIDGKVLAESIHPLRTYKNFPQEAPRKGDQLSKIDYLEVYDAEVVERISKSSPPGKKFIYQVDRSSSGQNSERLNIRIINGMRLAFMANYSPFFWKSGFWLAATGTFVSIVILLILIPFFRKEKKKYAALLITLLLVWFLFFFQLLHYLFLVIESDLSDPRSEQMFTVAWAAVLCVYALSYFYIKLAKEKTYVLLPSLLLAVFGLWKIYDGIYGSSFELESDWVEKFVSQFFLIHISAALLLSFLVVQKDEGLKKHLLNLVLGLAIGSWMLISVFGSISNEWLVFSLLPIAFYPMLNAAYYQLRFGKVSLVVTKTLQIVVFFAFGIFLYALISQAFGSLFPGNPYRRLMEIVTLILGIILGRTFYRSNEAKLNHYFTTSQQERYKKLRLFSASIPQFTSGKKLAKELKNNLKAYFEAEEVEIWWQHKQQQDSLDAKQIFMQLNESQAFWSVSKELSPLILTGESETQAAESTYELIAPLSVDETQNGLVLLGKKRKGVYNLADLELLSQLIQQTRLTLNVLALLSREQELVRETYEANLTVLRSQINPHFLFNTLNTISALIHDSPDLAEVAVEKLAFIFRYTLKASDKSLVSIKEEIKLVSTYLDIEKIRFGKRLQVQIEVEEKTQNVQIPAFVIQTLVENCIKHGIAKIMERGIVSIDIWIEGDFAICEIYDNGPGIEAERITKGTGLNNISTRMQNIYKIENLISFENTGNGTRVLVKIPLEN